MKKSKVMVIAVSVFFMFAGNLLGASFEEIQDKAEGQTVYFNAWGGAEVINDYILEAARDAKEQYGFEVKHVKVTDISTVVSRILVEKTAGKDENGSVDLMWINGENFKSMKQNGLLFGPFTRDLPSYQYVDEENKPTVLYDFTVPVDYMEAPWGMAQLVFMYDSAKISEPPEDMAGLLEFAKMHPGRFTYPSPPNFHGTTFIKQVLLELVPDRDVLNKPVSAVDFEQYTKPLWDFLDTLHPLMWRKGKVFTTNASEMKQLLNDSEVFIAFSFNPNEASNAIVNGELPETVRTYIHKTGTIGNSHFLAIPYNASAKEAAMVFINMLMSPEYQAKKADPTIWGDPTVLDVKGLPKKDRELFQQLDKGPATLSSEELADVLPEPHTSWVTALENEWKKRYSR